MWRPPGCVGAVEAHEYVVICHRSTTPTHATLLYIVSSFHSYNIICHYSSGNHFPFFNLKAAIPASSCSRRLKQSQCVAAGNSPYLFNEHTFCLKLSDIPDAAIFGPKVFAYVAAGLTLGAVSPRTL